MNGSALTLGLVGALAVAGAASRRGSRASAPRRVYVAFMGSIWRLSDADLRLAAQGGNVLSSRRPLRGPSYNSSTGRWSRLPEGLAQDKPWGGLYSWRNGVEVVRGDDLDADMARELLGERGSRAIRLPAFQQIEDARNRFLDALEALAGEKQVIYMGPFQFVGDRKGGLLGKLEIHVRPSAFAREISVHLGFIGVLKDERGEGRGSRLLQMVCDAADKAGLPVELDVSPQKQYGQSKPPMNKTQLKAFYAKFGFKPVKGRRDSMRREVGG